MPSCPAVVGLTITVISFALLVSFLAGMVGHGVLRPLLEARGISPWRIRDSLGSLPLVLIGSAMVGGAAAQLAVWGVTSCTAQDWVVVLVSALVVAGILMMRLGLLALQKLV